MKKLLLLGLISISTLSYGNDDVKLNLTINSKGSSFICKRSEIKSKIDKETKDCYVSYAKTIIQDKNNKTIGIHEDRNCFNIDHILTLHSNQEISQIDIDLTLTTAQLRNYSYFSWGNIAMYSLLGIAAYCFYKGYTQK